MRLVIAFALLFVTGCACRGVKVEPPVRVQCTSPLTGTVCAASLMLPDTICACTRAL